MASANYVLPRVAMHLVIYKAKQVSHTAPFSYVDLTGTILPFHADSHCQALHT
jgi:hypothetical protein